jgi:hypothetical protein
MRIVVEIFQSIIYSDIVQSNFSARSRYAYITRKQSNLAEEAS